MAIVATLGLVGSGAWAAKKLLGPLLDVYGEALADWQKARLRNVEKILENAQSKLSDEELKDAAATVPARIGMKIFEEGSYSDDPFVVDYLGGVLASARSGVSRDDRGIVWASLIPQLSAYSLRMHYTLYASWCAQIVGSGREINVAMSTDLAKQRLYIPSTSLAASFDLVDEEIDQYGEILVHSLSQLYRHSLINDYAHGGTETINMYTTPCTPPGLVFTPTSSGLELYQWANGMGKHNLGHILNVDQLEHQVDLPDGATLTDKLHDTPPPS